MATGLGPNIWTAGAWNHHVPYIRIGGAWVPFVANAGGISTSNSAMPIGNFGTHFIPVIQEDFNTPSSSGNFRTDYPAMTTYDGFTDTSGQGTYKTSAITVHDSMADILVGWDGTVERVAAILPNKYIGQLYGKYTMQLHMDTVAQYKIIPILLWSARDVWADGEVDFYENGIGSASALVINLHNVQGSPGTSYGVTVTGVVDSPSHIIDLEWTPGKMQFSIDGVVVRTTTNPIALPVNQMRWICQIEVADLSGATIPDHANIGHVYIDWICLYNYVP